MDTLKPTPEKPHYTFNLRDVSKVVQGVLMADKRRGREKEDIVRLWTHECCRVFSDRLINDKDRTWFLEQVKEQTKAVLAPVLQGRLAEDGELMYSDFLVSADPTIYEEVTDVGKLAEIDELRAQRVQRDEHPDEPRALRRRDGARLPHLARPPPAGRQLPASASAARPPVARLASHLADFRVFQIEITKNYRVLEWREDLKTVLKIAGYELKPVVFLFVDTQITDEIFLENVNNILSSRRGAQPDVDDCATWAPSSRR